MESLDLMGDLLDFASDIGEEDDDEEHLNKPNRRLSSTLNPNNVLDVFNHPLPDGFPEEELEWISNKDAFPSVDTIFDVFIEDPRTSSKHQSPVSVLDNSTTLSSHSNNSSRHSNDSVMMSICRSIRIPVKARSKQIRKARSDFGSYRCWWSQESLKKVRVVKSSSTTGRRCQHCGTEKTPQWRAGPEGPKTLCNACGVRFKSGRLVPEYRPASSPTFSSLLHSNSHRKVVEMRKQKQMMGMLVVKPMEKG